MKMQTRMIMFQTASKTYKHVVNIPKLVKVCLYQSKAESMFRLAMALQQCLHTNHMQLAHLYIIQLRCSELAVL